MTKEAKRGSGEERAPLTRAQWVFMVAAGLLLVGSVAARVAASPETGDGTTPEMAAGLVSGERSPAEAEEPGTLEALLPYVTEASLFALLGFAVGYATRKVVKVLLILIALFFVSVQLLGHAGLVEVEWGGVVGSLNDLIFNLKEDEPLTRILTDRVPSTGAFLLGVVLGFKRG